MVRRAVVVVNPISGRGRGLRAARALEQALRRREFEVDLRPTRAPGEARAIASSLDGASDLVVSVGGDGTLNEVVNGLALRPIPVGIFPVGTSNVFALDLALPRDPERAADAFARGRTFAVDLARADGRLSFFVVGVGFDAMVLSHLERRRRGPIGKWRYLPAALRAFARYEAPRLRVVVDGERIDGVAFAIVANTVHYGGRFFGLARDRRLDDGFFECYLFRGRGRLDLARYALRGALRRVCAARDVEFRRARGVSVESSTPAPYQVDGDYAGVTPVRLEVLPRALPVLVP